MLFLVGGRLAGKNGQGKINAREQGALAHVAFQLSLSMPLQTGHLALLRGIMRIMKGAAREVLCFHG
jgi:hypothetical protein